MSSALAEVDWNTLLNDPGLLVVVAVWAIIGAVVLGIIIAIQWRRVRQAQHEAALKQQMIERGFSADEIVSVINAGISHRKAPKSTNQANQPAHQPCCSESPASG